MSIPKNWIKTDLKNVVRYQKGRKPSILQDVEFRDSVPYLDIKALEKNEIRHYADVRSSVLLDESSVAMVWDGARSGWVSKGRFGALGSTLAALKPIETDVTYLYYFLKSQFEFINTNVRGIGIPHVDPDRLWAIQFPLAPISYQKPISKKLDQIFGHLGILNNRLDRIPELIKIFKEKVLSYAVTGKLTEEWREKNRKIENSTILLQKLIQNRSENYQDRLEDSKKYNYPKPKKPILEIAKVKDDYFKFPNTWTLTNFETAAEKIFDGTHFSPKNISSGKYKYITAKNIKEWGIDLSNVTYVDESVHKKIYSRADVKHNDVLYIKDGATTGVATLNTLDEEFSLLSSVGVFRFNEEYILPKFIVYFLSSIKQKMISNVSGIAITRLTLEKLNAAPLLIPPIEEQKEIVRIIDALFLLSKKIENSYNELNKSIESLPKATLKKAFSGNLTI